MQLIKLGKEFTVFGNTFRLPSRVLMNVECDEEGRPCDDEFCCEVHDTPEKYPEYKLV